jgi:hypothetical protein
MSEFKGTPGPWVSETNQWGETSVKSANESDLAEWPVEYFIAEKIGGHVRGEDFTDFSEVYANAKLIASAPDLFWALKIKVDNAEQRAFEDWLTRTAPSGDCDSVHSQWLESSDYEDFTSDWDLQITAIAKATE